MQKNAGIFTVGKKLVLGNQQQIITVEDALSQAIRQAKAEGLRDATLVDYSKFYVQYVEFNKFTHIHQFDSTSIYSWLNSMTTVTNVTKKVRLKALRAVLNRLLRAKLLKEDFFNQITIKTDQKVKEGATEDDINLLLSQLDLTDWYQLRDAASILLIWQTGVRLSTLSQLTIDNIDFSQKLLICEGSIMKNHKRLILPIGDQLIEVLQVLVSQNRVIAEEKGFSTDLIFMTATGKPFNLPNSCNTLSKRLRQLSIKYDIPNITAHGIRRGFAKRLMDDGVSVPVISKALGHSSLSSTTQYLHISEAEVINEIRRLH